MTCRMLFISSRDNTVTRTWAFRQVRCRIGLKHGMGLRDCIGCTGFGFGESGGFARGVALLIC